MMKSLFHRARPWFVCLLSLLLLLFPCAGCAPEPQSISFTAMDTFMNATIYGGSSSSSGTVLEDLKARVLELEGELSVTAEGSDIYTLNQNGSADLSPDTADLLDKALGLCQDTQGALDITIYPVVRAWGFTTGEYQIPSQQELDALLPLVDWSSLLLEDAHASLPDRAAVDLGSVAKGYTGDVLSALLQDNGVSSALLELGGNIQTVGSKPDGSPWRVAIQDPNDLENYVGVLQVSGKAVVTSGGYQRYFEEDGVRYWHILDPRTGTPARTGLVSVTIVGDSGLLCDAFSTALFVMGPEQALDFWRSRRDFEAVLIMEDGSITITEGLRDSFSLMGEHELTVAQ